MLGAQELLGHPYRGMARLHTNIQPSDPYIPVRGGNLLVLAETFLAD